jgi:hypothetical protein
MKFEALLMRGLFVACTAVCALIFGAMLNATPSQQQPGSADLASTVLASAPSSCAMPSDGVICPWSHS